MSLNKSEELSRLLNGLKIGSVLIKQKGDGDKYSRHFYLDDNEDFISYYQSEKVFSQPRRYYIREIDEIRMGFQTLTFDRLIKKQIIRSDDEELAFSIFYNNYREELHLMANDQYIRNMWVVGLQYLIDTYANKRQRTLIRDNDWILSQLTFADKDKSNTMNRDECRQLLTDSLNIDLPEEIFENVFQYADKHGQGVLAPENFITFFNILARRTDLFQIMQQHVENGDQQTIETITMNINELLDFLQNVQNQNILVYTSRQMKNEFSVQSITKREQVQQLINEFEPNINLKKKGLISLDGFRNLLLSDEFSLMKPWCSRRAYQDMTRPLSDYYINTSHNTYLFDNQIIGDSNPEAYNRALRAGCRAIELDCHDGEDGQPIVTHGYTLVRSCSFESIIRFIEPNLFKTSPYPVILDIENHCSIGQQKEMARILREVLGDRLVTESIRSKNVSVLPSPEELKYKVLIRTLRTPSSTTITKLSGNEQNDNNKIIADDLSNLIVSFENVPYREYEYTKDNYFCFHSSSLSERQFERVSETDSIGLLNQSQRCILRVYPDGLRQDSSNPNPIMPWNFGIQMVALNYQTDDHMMSLSFGKFSDNGSCGYVLKPNYLIDVQKSKFNPLDYLVKAPSNDLISKNNINEHPQRLIITIISGQFLNRSSTTTDDIPDPYVVISTHGITSDEKIEKTRFIENNGFNPIWNETFIFDIDFPQMCLICFDVYDYDIFSRDDRLAYFCLPVTTIQTGYRHIHLRSKDHDSTYSTLFIHIAIENK